MTSEVGNNLASRRQTVCLSERTTMLRKTCVVNVTAEIKTKWSSNVCVCIKNLSKRVGKTEKKRNFLQHLCTHKHTDMYAETQANTQGTLTYPCSPFVLVTHCLTTPLPVFSSIWDNGLRWETGKLAVTERQRSAHTLSPPNSFSYHIFNNKIRQVLTSIENK